MPIDEKLAHWADKEYKRKNYPSAAEKLQMGLSTLLGVNGQNPVLKFMLIVLIMDPY